MGMTLLGAEDADAEADGVTVLTGRVPMIAAASLGDDTVVVLANELMARSRRGKNDEVLGRKTYGGTPRSQPLMKEPVMARNLIGKKWKWGGQKRLRDGRTTV